MVVNLILLAAVVGILLAGLWVAEESRPRSGLDSFDVAPPRGMDHPIDADHLPADFDG